jgi:hypothetical protein
MDAAMMVNIDSDSAVTLIAMVVIMAVYLRRSSR